ncbi:ROK family transcriptional regulator [Halobacillus sp. Marseille-Q1614]|uniref:ROK family transcriptional regulator n=1 Tax=Halobacillus sp. Marseille-Q1614 TaxID=2709134 RepID=UPI0015701496|nr:ROK family transcriptional regulator [Halobacillus sp. Marseille-Q1614]
MHTGDANYIKNLNRKILIENIIREKSLSRSDLARRTGLNKATVSSQISRLLQEGIIKETIAGDMLTPGRKPILIEMNEQAGYSLGIDIDHKVARAVFIDFKGKPFYKKNIEVTEEDATALVNEVMAIVNPLINSFNQTFSPVGLTGVCLGIHGILDNQGHIVFTPKEKWSNINIKEVIESELKVPVYLDNNANLSAYGEQVYFESIPDMFCITLYSGIGLGIINNYNIYRGYKGFAGEVGHMVINPNGAQCSCGNRGCWELYASEKALANKVNNQIQLLKDRTIDSLLTDPSFKDDLEEYATYLGIGLNNIINIFNPQRIVINGILLNNNPVFIQHIKERLISKMSSYEEIRFSHLGEYACALGGAAYVIKKYFNINTLDYIVYDYFTEDSCEESFKMYSIG